MASVARRVLIDDTDSLIHYGSSWTQQQETLLDMGSAGPPFKRTLHSTSANTTFSAKFTGTNLSVVGSVSMKKTAWGELDPQWACRVDGILLTSSAFPNGLQENQQTLCSATSDQISDSDVEHEVVVTVLTRGAEFYLDYLQYTPGKGVGLEDKIVKIDNMDSAIQYEGFGGLGNFANATQTAGSTVKFDFIGKSVSWLGFVVKELARPQSSATYAIDGGDPTTFKLNGLSDTATNSLGNQVFFTTPDLEPGAHSLLVTHKGNGQQTPLVLDYLIVTNATETHKSTSGGKSTPIGAIVGGVVGGVVVILALILLGVWLSRRRRRRGQEGVDVAGGGGVESTRNTSQVTPFSGGAAGAVYDSSNSNPFLLSPGTTTGKHQTTAGASGYIGTSGSRTGPPTATTASSSYYGGHSRSETMASSSAMGQSDYSPMGKRQEAAAEASQAQSQPPTEYSAGGSVAPSVRSPGTSATTTTAPRILHHQDSGIRMPEAEEEVIEVPPTYTAV